MHVSCGGFGVKDHKTSFLQFNNPFNTIFQSHFMLSKARISELFADIGFVEELLFIKRWRHDLIMVHHYWVASVPHPRNAFLWCVQFFHSNDSCLMVKWFDSTCLLLEERHIPTFCLKNLFKCSPLLNQLWILRRKCEFNCLKMHKGKGNSGPLNKLWRDCIVGTWWFYAETKFFHELCLPMTHRPTIKLLRKGVDKRKFSP